MFPEAADVFACALGVPVSEEETPHLYTILRRTLADAGLSTYAAKRHYNRVRPFVVNGQETCTQDEADLKDDGSYPSGHAAFGWTWALILSEIAPDRADAILSRGRALGESRIICNVHWQSDVTEGRTMGAATVAKLHANSAFMAELAIAKSEYAAMLEKGLELGRDCAEEAITFAK